MEYKITSNFLLIYRFGNQLTNLYSVLDTNILLCVIGIFYNNLKGESMLSERGRWSPPVIKAFW